jgi:hypothetical protein
MAGTVAGAGALVVRQNTVLMVLRERSGKTRCKQRNPFVGTTQAAGLLARPSPLWSPNRSWRGFLLRGR